MGSIFIHVLVLYEHDLYTITLTRDISFILGPVDWVLRTLVV